MDPRLSVLGKSTANSALLNVPSRINPEWGVTEEEARLYPGYNLAGSVLGQLPVAIATGGASLPAQMAIQSGLGAASSAIRGDSAQEIALGGLLGAAGPVAGKALGAVARKGYDAAQGLAGAALHASRGLSPRAAQALENATPYFEHQAAYDKLSGLGRQLQGLQDAIRKEASPEGAAALRDHYFALKNQFDTIHSNLSLTKEETENGIRNYLRNSLDSDSIERLKVGQMPPQAIPDNIPALSSGVAKIYSTPTAAVSARNVAGFADKDAVLGVRPAYPNLSNAAIQKLSGIAKPSALNQKEFVDSTMSLNPGEYLDPVLRDKLARQAAMQLYGDRIAQQVQTRQNLGDFSNVLGTSSAIGAGRR